jgi:hypothetical protein
MNERYEAMEAAVKRMPLADRFKSSRERIAHMCEYGHGPKMRIPAEPTDDDLFICDTLRDAEAEIAALRATLGEARGLLKRSVGLEHNAACNAGTSAPRCQQCNYEEAVRAFLGAHNGEEKK